MVEFFFERKTVFSLVQILEGSRECHEMPEMRARKDISWRKEPLFAWIPNNRLVTSQCNGLFGINFRFL